MPRNDPESVRVFSAKEAEAMACSAGGPGGSLARAEVIEGSLKA
jgi:hypothetical protein